MEFFNLKRVICLLALTILQKFFYMVISLTGKIHEIKGAIERRIASFLVRRRKKSSCKTSTFVLFLCAFVVLCAIGTIWPARCFASKYSAYTKTKTDNKTMRVKPFLFANRLKETKHLPEKIQANRRKTRPLLALGTKKSIIEDDLLQNLDENGFISGQAMLATILSGSLSKVNYTQLPQQTDNLYAQHTFMYQSYDEIISHFMAVPCGKPCDGHISSHYGFRLHPTSSIKKDFHNGLDIANAINTPVRCTASGKVVFSGWQSGYGNMIIIDHGHNYRTAYGHLLKKLVTVGTYVRRGQIIAKMGNTGTSTGSHVHYEVHFRGKSVNPKPYLADYFCLT